MIAGSLIGLENASLRTLITPAACHGSTIKHDPAKRPDEKGLRRTSTRATRFNRYLRNPKLAMRD